MIKRLLALFNPELTYLQRKEFEEGMANGLDEEQLAFLSRHGMNHEKMHEIRLCMEEGIPMKQIRKLIQSEAEEIKRKRKQILRGEIVDLKSFHWGTLSVYMMAFGVICLLISGFIQGRNRPYLRLKTDTVELKKGESFDPMSYIDSYSSADSRLYLPESLNTSKEGSYIVVYKLVSGKHEIIESMRVHVKD